MQVDVWMEAARTRAKRRERTGGSPESAVDLLQSRCRALFDRLPAPPLYRRASDPARAQAEACLSELADLFVDALALEREREAEVRPWRQALESHAVALCETTEGRFVEAEEAWLEGTRQAERAVGAMRRFAPAGDGATMRVFDPETGRSRYDAVELSGLRVKLICPRASCHAQQVYEVHGRGATHRFSCPRCANIFDAYFADSRKVEAAPAGRTRLRYTFSVEARDGNGTMARIVGEASSAQPFVVPEGERLAFLYSEDRHLEAVLNLATGQVLWVLRSGVCFLATAVFGEDAAELELFRRFRDESLQPCALGRSLIRLYLRVGPGLAALSHRSSVFRGASHRALSAVHAQLLRRQQRAARSARVNVKP